MGSPLALPGCPSPNNPDPVFDGCVVLGFEDGKSPLGCCVLLWPNPEKSPPDPEGCDPEKRPPEGADMVVEVPKFEAAFCAVSPDGAKILVLLFAGCSELVPALTPEKRPAPLEAGMPED